MKIFNKNKGNIWCLIIALVLMLPSFLKAQQTQIQGRKKVISGSNLVDAISTELGSSAWKLSGSGGSLPVYSVDSTYVENQLVDGGDGYLYESQVNSNLGNALTINGTNWKLANNSIGIGNFDQTTTENRTFTIGGNEFDIENTNGDGRVRYNLTNVEAVLSVTAQNSTGIIGSNPTTSIQGSLRANGTTIGNIGAGKNTYIGSTRTSAGGATIINGSNNGDNVGILFTHNWVDTNMIILSTSINARDNRITNVGGATESSDAMSWGQRSILEGDSFGETYQILSDSNEYRIYDHITDSWRSIGIKDYYTSVDSVLQDTFRTNEIIYVGEARYKCVALADSLSYPIDSLTQIPIIIESGAAGVAYIQPNDEGILHVDWLGAVSNDGQADDVAVQKAIDIALVTSASHVADFKIGVIQFGSGQYKLDKGVVVAVQESGGSYDFNSIELRGINPNYDVARSPSTKLLIKNYDGGGIFINAMRQIKISNLSFVGDITGPSSPEEYITWTDSDWSNSGQFRDNEHSPYAGIIIDAFDDDATSDRYPDFHSYYTYGSQSGSSMVEIEGCTFDGLIVGIMVSPSKGMSNGDNIISRTCSVVRTKVFWGTGQDQTKGNRIENLYARGCQVIMDGRRWGRNIGTLPFLTGSNNIAGATKYLFITNSGNRANVNISDVFAESCWMIGVGDITTQVNIANSTLGFTTPDDLSYWMPPFLAEMPINFDNTTLRYYGQGFTPMHFVEKVNFDGLNPLSNPVVIRERGNTPGEDYMNIGFVQDRNLGVLENQVNTYNIDQFIRPGDYFYQQEEVKTEALSTNPLYYNVATETSTVTIDTSTYTASFTSSSPGMYIVGDVITNNGSVDVSTLLDGETTTSFKPTLGYVSSINNDTITLKGVPFGHSTGSKNLQIIRKYQSGPTFIGSAVSGSPYIINCVFPEGVASNFDLENEPIYGSDIPAGAHVESISNDTVTMSLNFSSSNTNQVFTTFPRKRTFLGTTAEWALEDQVVWNIGDEVIITDGNISTMKQVCTSPGRKGSTVTPVFKSIINSQTCNTFSSNTDGSGDVAITHGHDLEPDIIKVNFTGSTPYLYTVQSKSSSTITVRVFDTSGSAVTSTSVSFNWCVE